MYLETLYFRYSHWKKPLNVFVSFESPFPVQFAFVIIISWTFLNFSETTEPIFTKFGKTYREEEKYVNSHILYPP